MAVTGGPVAAVGGGREELGMVDGVGALGDTSVGRSDVPGSADAVLVLLRLSLVLTAPVA
jgi:hypothetical protein